MDCVSSGSGKCIVTNKTTIIKNAINGDYIEWKIKPLNTEQEAITAQSNYNYNFVVNAKNGGCSLSPILCALLVIPNKNDLLTGEEYTLADKVLVGLGATSLVAGSFLRIGKETSANRPLNLGSTGRNIPVNLSEKLALDQAISNPTAGIQLPVPMTDRRWPAVNGWVKMSQNINGIEIHYVRNTKTGAIDDFKFK